MTVTELYWYLTARGKHLGVCNVIIWFLLGVIALNSFINGVESLNTSLLLAVQRLAKTVENCFKERSIEGKDAEANETGPGNVQLLQVRFFSFFVF